MKANYAAEWDRISKQLDVGYSYNFALELEKYKTHNELGFRTAGSSAEAAAGDRILSEMLKLGISAEKEEITVDGWDFKRAKLAYTDNGTEKEVMLSAYQTDFETDGYQSFTLINAGRGTADDFNKLDVTGKIALVFINQRDEWWINYPAYQAYLRGARAIIAVQNNGFGELSASALNAQDICGPSQAAAFSMSKKDAKKLINAGFKFGFEIPVKIDAYSRVTPKTKTFNITGIIKGKSDNIIMVSAHYDSYFKGFQDDNTGVSMMLSMANALVKSGYQPEKTLVFCAFAAEEWGTIDSRYDWSAGAYAFMSQSHPDWKNRIIADINLELPAFSHGARHYIRCVYEYKSYLNKFVASLPQWVKALYPKGVAIICPVQTWSDDFSLATAGIPSMVNEFKVSRFIETHYHSQFDSDDCYNEKVYYFHHNLYLRILLALDDCAVPPVNFAARFKAMDEALTLQSIELSTEGNFRKAVFRAKNASKKLYRRIRKINALIPENNSFYDFTAQVLKLFKKCEKKFVALDWNELSVFPFENVQKNIILLKKAACHLWTGNKTDALNVLVEIDDNNYAKIFDREVTEYFANRALGASKETNKWGYGKLKSAGRIDLYDLIARLKKSSGGNNFTKEIAELKALLEDSYQDLDKILKQMTKDLNKICEEMEQIIKKD